MEPVLEIIILILAGLLVILQIARWIISKSTAIQPLPQQTSLARERLDFERGQQSPQDIESLLKRGEKIKAIKRYREQYGVGLKEAKQAIDELQASMEQDLLQRKEQLALSGQQLHEDLQERIAALIQQNRKIEAIKLYREGTGTGLKEAKNAVDQLQTEMQYGRSEGGIPTDEISAEVAAKQLIDPDKLQWLLREQGKIQAIKYYREVTGLGLKEAKDAVDWLASNTPEQE